MADLLVKLYEMKETRDFLTALEAQGILIRKPMGPEKSLVVDWVRDEFGENWSSETDTALSNRPSTCFIAIQDRRVIGFGCYDATQLGYFGPTGVLEIHRGRGIGKALLLACLLDMKSKGYSYAIIGWAGPTEFYAKAVGAVEIPDSTPGAYRTMLERDKTSDATGSQLKSIVHSNDSRVQIVGSREELTAQSVVEIVVPDLPAALEFYRKLGFTTERETPGFVTVRWESVFLFVAQNDNAIAIPRWTNVRIVVSNVDAIWERVQQLQLPVGSPIADRPYGLRDFTVKDPAGFEIRFAQVIV